MELMASSICDTLLHSCRSRELDILKWVGDHDITGTRRSMQTDLQRATERDVACRRGQHSVVWLQIDMNPPIPVPIVHLCHLRSIGAPRIH